ncbi:MAG TPA: 2'-5' RNA ligase family protein [Phenylobacterium sp.]
MMSVSFSSSKRVRPSAFRLGPTAQVCESCCQRRPEVVYRPGLALIRIGERVLRDDYTSVVLPFLRLGAVIDDFRAVHIRTPAATLPAHVTLLAPFVTPEEVDGACLERLGSLFRNESPLTLTFARLGRFNAAEVLYLAPDPTAPLERLARAIHRIGGAPDLPPGEHVFHLTVAHRSGHIEKAESEFIDRYGGNLPFTETPSAAVLYEKRNGAWQSRATFPFSRAGAP